MDSYALLERLCNSPGVSGFEAPVREAIAELIEPFVDELRVDQPEPGQLRLRQADGGGQGALDSVGAATFESRLHTAAACANAQPTTVVPAGDLYGFPHGAEAGSGLQLSRNNASCFALLFWRAKHSLLAGASFFASTLPFRLSRLLIVSMVCESG
jgi:hypothetical protein